MFSADISVSCSKKQPANPEGARDQAFSGTGQRLDPVRMPARASGLLRRTRKSGISGARGAHGGPGGMPAAEDGAGGIMEFGISFLFA